MGLLETINDVLATAKKLRASTAANEANTKALMIEPLLGSLGWNPFDLDIVEREVKVFDGTFLDYALKVAGDARLYVEAKSVGGNLDDKKFVAQAINYANNDGVLWCVLTNGLRYRVYKTNEPVAMDQKLLFEVDLIDETDPLNEKVKLLRLVSRDAVEDGTLDAFGDRVFTDTRVRKALSELASDPPDPLLSIITKQMGHPAVSSQALRRSLVRVLDGTAPSGAQPAKPPLTPSGAGSAPKKPVGPAAPPKGEEHSLDHHLGNKSALIRELWEEVDKHAMSLGADVTRRIRKQYIGYFRGKKSFLTAEVQQRRVLVYLSLNAENAKPWNDDVMRDASQIGHFGMGDIEYSLVTVDQLADVSALVSLAYNSK